MTNPRSYFSDLTELESEILRRTEEIGNISYDVTPLREMEEDAVMEVAACDPDEGRRLGNTDWYAASTFIA